VRGLEVHAVGGDRRCGDEAWWQGGRADEGHDGVEVEHLSVLVVVRCEGDAVSRGAVELESGTLDLRVGHGASDAELAALRGVEADKEVRDPRSVHVGRVHPGVEAAGDEQRAEGDVPGTASTGSEGVGDGNQFG